MLTGTVKVDWGASGVVVSAVRIHLSMMAAVLVAAFTGLSFKTEASGRASNTATSRLLGWMSRPRQRGLGHYIAREVCNDSDHHPRN